MADKTTCLVVWAFINHHVSVTHYNRSYDAQMARNRSALDSVLAPGVSNRDNTVYSCNFIGIFKPISRIDFEGTLHRMTQVSDTVMTRSDWFR